MVGALALVALCVAPGRAQELRGLVALADSSPVIGAVVELHRVTETTGALVDSTTTDASGVFAFVLPSDVDPSALFLAGARYEGVLYWGPPTHSTNPSEREEYTVVVFDTTVVAAPASDLRTAIRHVVITPNASGLQVEEIIDVEGRPAGTLVGQADSVLVWTTMLARNARGVVPAAGGVPFESLVPGDRGVGFRGALPPSGIRVVLQYVVPSREYELELDHPTERLEVLVMSQPGLDLRVSGLEEAVVGGEMSVPVRRFTGTDLVAGDSVTVRASIEGPPSSSAGIWFLISLALGAAALVSVRLNARSSQR